MPSWFNAATHHPDHRPAQDTPPGKVLPGQPVEDPIPPEMSPVEDMPEMPHPSPES